MPVASRCHDCFDDVLKSVVDVPRDTQLPALEDAHVSDTRRPMSIK